MSGNKFLRKLAKHSLWLLIGFVTGMTFVGYFSPIRELVFEFFTGQADGWSYFWVGFFTLATYGNAGWLREQVCIYMRSEEHTSELQSLMRNSYAVFCLKTKKKAYKIQT